MLEELVKGKDVSKIISIEDTYQAGGRSLLKCIISQLTSQVQHVHVIHYDTVSLDEIKKDLPANVLSSVSWHDYSRDLLGWDGHSPDVSRKLPVPDSSRSEAYVFHSLSPLLLFNNAAYTCQTLHNLQQIKEQPTPIVALVHQDLHDETTMKLLHHVSSTIISILSSNDSNMSGTCDILHKKTSGKINKKTEQFKIAADFSSIDVCELISVSRSDQVEQKQETDPAANLTFNLTLKDSEKEARDALQLPYVKIHDKQVQPEAQIFYQPDDADDYDEEDPDDDLDI